LDRALIAAFGDEGVVTGMKVTQRAAGANYSVDVAAGSVLVAGDEIVNQGSYFARFAAANLPLDTPPQAGGRIDLIAVTIRDTDSGASAGTPAELRVIKGSASGSPAAPAVPNSTLVIAEVLLTAGLSSVLNASITDRRSLARPRVVVSSTEPSDPIDGLIWLRPVG
jgi:hypothetical protein